MRFGFAVPAYGSGADGAAVAELVAAGEELGYYAAWLPDHVAVPGYAAAVNLSPPFLEPLATCAWGLGVTSRLRFGTDVLVAGYRHPLLVRAMAGTLGRLAGDRLILGVGIGYLRGEFDALGVAYATRAPDTEEWLRRFHRPLEGLSVVEPPVRTPLWVGGNGPRAVRRAATLGDGWHPLWLPPDRYRAARQEILSLRAASGLDAPFTFSFSASRTELLDRALEGWPAPPPRPRPGSEFAYAPPPWRAPDGRPCLTGTPDQVTADLQALADAGVEHVTLRFATTDPEPLARFARQVMPALSDP